MIKILIILILIVSSTFSSNRVVVLSPALNEIIFAIGAGNEIVGNTEYSNYPIESKNIPKVGGYFSTSIEKILALKPNIVFMENIDKKVSKKLNIFGIRNEIIDIKNLNNIKSAILKIGKILDREIESEKIVNKIDKKLNSIKNIVKNRSILIVIGEYKELNKNIFVAGSNLYFEDIIKISGNKNALTSSRLGQPILNQERLIASNPDIVIILAPYFKKSKNSKDDLIEPWLKLPIKVKNSKNIFIIDKEYAGIPSDRLIYLLDDFKKILENVANR